MRYWLSIILAMTLVPPAASAADKVTLGESIVTLYCASCHAVGKTGDSPHPQAPAFRDLHLRYDVSDLMEGLVEGLVSEDSTDDYLSLMRDNLAALEEANACR